MGGKNDWARLSDLVRLCASTVRILAELQCRDGASSEAMGLAVQLEAVAFDMRQLAKEKSEEFDAGLSVDH